MMTKYTAIINKPVGSGYVPTVVYFEAPAKCSTSELMCTLNDVGYKTQKEGYEYDIDQYLSFLFYGHVEHVR